MELGPKSFLFTKWETKAWKENKEPAQGHTASTWWSWGLYSRFDPDFVSSHNASSETTNCFSLSLNLFRLYASFRINMIKVPHEAPFKQPRPHTPHALNFCRATALPSHPQLHSIIPLVSLFEAPYTVPTGSLVLSGNNSYMFTQKGKKVWLINIYFGLSTIRSF